MYIVWLFRECHFRSLTFIKFDGHNLLTIYPVQVIKHAAGSSKPQTRRDWRAGVPYPSRLVEVILLCSTISIDLLISDEILLRN